MHTATMDGLLDAEMEMINGGAVPVAALVFAGGAYMTLLNKIESNPNDYTFLMDWYYAD